MKHSPFDAPGHPRVTIRWPDGSVMAQPLWDGLTVTQFTDWLAIVAPLMPKDCTWLVDH